MKGYKDYEITLDDGSRWDIDNIRTFINDAGPDIFEPDVRWVIYQVGEYGRDGAEVACSKKEAFDFVTGNGTKEITIYTELRR